MTNSTGALGGIFLLGAILVFVAKTANMSPKNSSSIKTMFVRLMCDEIAVLEAMPTNRT